MNLSQNGIDILYIDESGRQPRFAASAVRVPFLRKVGEQWTYVWEDHRDAADRWRRGLSKDFGVRFHKELHGVEILKSQGHYLRGAKNLTPYAVI
jgi:hypothetical protein